MMRLLVPLAYSGAIFLLSSIPGDLPGEPGLLTWVPPELQNLLHIPLFAGLAGCWWWALHEATPRRRSILAMMFSVGYGVIDELYQSTVPGRFGSLTDLALNVTGALCAIVVLLLWQRRVRGSQPPA